MNIQALMKQAQSMQKDMEKAQKEIAETEFQASNELVEIVAFGTKELKKVTIKEGVATEDKEYLEDMILLAINKIFADIDKVTEEKMGKFANMPGLF